MYGLLLTPLPLQVIDPSSVVGGPEGMARISQSLRGKLLSFKFCPEVETMAVVDWIRKLSVAVAAQA